jgi:DNA polymerase elongation subunit (family B)
MAKKKSKNEKEEDKKQTSLVSFGAAKEPKKPKEKKEPSKIVKEEILTESSDELKTARLAKQQQELKKQKQELTKVPEELFFKGNQKPFGLKAGDIELEKIKREGFESRYLRYLIKKGEIVQNLERGFLLDIDYDGGQNKAYCKFYDLNSHEIKIWIDTTDHEPYCISKQSIQQLENNVNLTNYEGFLRFEEIKRFDLLRDKKIKVTKIYGKTPTDIGGSGTNIRSILGDAWEAKIRYHLNYIYDRALIPGLVYRIKDGKIHKIEYQGDPEEYEKVARELQELFKDENTAIQNFAKNNIELFLSEIPDVQRMAMDIEVNMGPKDYLIPDPRQAKQEVISISFVATDGVKIVYMLERDGYVYGDPHQHFPEDAEVLYFTSEKELLTETFRLMWKYPVILTFNGDNFDLNYLFHRANRLKIEKDLNPIIVKRGYGFMSKAECDLRKGIHIDLFNFFFNRSISGYAFGGAYKNNSLNAISAALLGEEKYQHEEEIHEMEYNILSWYNLKDSILTLELSKFNNSLVWNLIILLCRITKMPIHDMVRYQISSWIQNIFYYEHRQKKYLIPRKEEISELKPGGYSKSIIDGKGFKGAYVIPPTPGIHYDVVVMDFSSLYPTIIKEYNLSYETIQCPHEDCRDNLLKGIPYHVCSHKMGIFAYVVGFLRDIRVKYFKPKSKDTNLSEKRRDYYTTIQQAIKVFINGCLPYNEEVIIKKKDNKVSKIKIGDLERNWKGKDILSIERNSGKFGQGKFVNIVGVNTRKAEDYLEITLSDGRKFQCTSNHIIPKIENLTKIKEIEARNLKIGDEILVYHKNPLNTHPPKKIFIPNYIPTNNLWVSLERKEYKKYSYRTNESKENPIINLINSKFKYSKVSKIYKCLWDELETSEKFLIEKVSLNHDLHFSVKYGEESGKWIFCFLDLPLEFFGLLGWYIAEGSIDKNRISITPKKKLHPKRYNHIISLLKSLKYPFSYDNKKQIRINSKILKQLFIRFCSKGAAHKKIPLELLDYKRAKFLLKNYYLGDGNLKKGKWIRYSTKSEQLKNDLVYLIGALDGYCSVVNPKKPTDIYRIIQTEGREYRRKTHGVVNFNGTTPVRIKDIKKIAKKINIYDIETANGWFIATNGIVVHNSYGVFGSKNFPLFCLPVAESTTAIGQYSIKKSIEKAESMGVDILYGDTDSIFLDNPSEEQMKNISEWSKKELDLDLEEEKTYQFLALSERKKNYIGIHKDSKYVDMKGLLAKKRNTPEFIKKIFGELIEILKHITNDEEYKESKDKIVSIVKDNLRKIGKEGAFDLEDYAINTAITKALDKYKVTPQHISAALELKKLTGKEYQKGEVMSYVKTKTSNGARATEIAKLQEIDVKKYRELLKSALEQVLDALGVTWQEIKGIKKMDAFF